MRESSEMGLCPLQAVVYASPCGIAGRGFDRDPIKALRIQTVQGVVKDSCVARRVNRHRNIVRVRVGARHPEIGAPARAGQMQE